MLRNRWPTEGQLRELIENELRNVDPDVVSEFENIACGPFEAPCERKKRDTNETYVEKVWVVAKKNNRVIFLDDIEEEWATSKILPNGLIPYNGTWGPLLRAIREFSKSR